MSELHPVIVATMLLGPGTEQMSRLAWESVANCADAFLCIDTRKLADHNAEDFMPEYIADRVTVVQWDWTGHYDDARNHALMLASALGGDYALTIDTDERLTLQHVGKLHELLRANPDVDCFSVARVDGKYAKERLIRLASKPEWVGWTHESLIANRPGKKPGVCFKGTMPRSLGSFTELDKTPAEYEHKAKRDLELLNGFMHSDHEHARNPRWFRYTGESLAMLGMWGPALEAFLVAGGSDEGDPEERAWAMFRAAEMMAQVEDYDRIPELSGVGIGIDPGYTQELAAIAAHACMQRGRLRHAERWARLAARAGIPEDRSGHTGAQCYDMALAILAAIGDAKTKAGTLH
jgi:hypothetical protein